MKIESSVIYDSELIELDIYELDGCILCETYTDLFDALEVVETFKRQEGPIRIEIMIGGFITFRWQKGEFK